MTSSQKPRKRQLPKRLARFLWIASKLNGETGESLEAWCKQETGLEVQLKQVQELVKPLRPKTRRGRPPKQRKTRRRDADDREHAIVDWLLVDEARLELLVVLYRLPSDGMPRPDLYDVISELPGVRQVIETKRDRELLVIGLVRSLKEADALRSLLEEHAPEESVSLDLVQRETHLPAVQTWTWLAKREAKAQGA